MQYALAASAYSRRPLTGAPLMITSDCAASSMGFARKCESPQTPGEEGASACQTRLP